MTTTQLQMLLSERIPDSTVSVRDLTGTSDHFHVEVVAGIFEGKSLIDQHKIVHAACAEHMGGAIHALQIKTRAE